MRPIAPIERLECRQIRWPMPEPLANSISVFRERATVVVSITSGGVTGWGECWAEPVASQTIIETKFAPVVLGADASTPKVIWDAMMNRLGRDRSGITHMAASAIDMAVWDLSARLDGVSLARKLGGALNDRLPTYASGPFLKVKDDPYSDMIAEIESYLERGFKSLKLRLGKTVKQDLNAVASIRKRFGEVPLMVDFNQGLSRLEARLAVKELADYGIRFVEEPLQADDIDGYRDLAQFSSIPIAGGESLAGIRRFKDFISSGALQIVQPDVAHCGGVTEYQRIVSLGEAFGVDVIPHVWSSVIIHAASLQLASMTPARHGYDLDFPLFEIDPTPNRLLDIFGAVQPGNDGSIEVPDLPGIGLALNHDILKPFTISHVEM
ncbi:mandelate racemase/muconate lactonizing enzyme family protein [Brucella pseudogrignonensis]|uniref:mandelate racemase/muconate lactonizing enzyme family protein n=1 Tax=Brucella pseudogrignonensis TaxID=419475 RepID=UPI0028B35800|nr:mandelate racemase/muconate lactonizing enzyme family protein [Brucella pseudogrignonensis]MDT6942429.1 mandelate racemase/muconate lactonizing enzyme family protein [Brucella pseudogrignonensis]